MHRELMLQLSLPFPQWTVEQGWTCDTRGIVMAAKHNRMDIIKWLTRHLNQMYHRMMARHDRGDCSCARAGSESTAGAAELVPRCLNDGVDGDIGAREAERRLLDRDSNRVDRVWFPQAFDLIHVAVGGDVESIEFQSSTNVMNKAAESGHYELVAWLHTHRSEGCTTAAMDLAAKNGNLKIVQFLHKNRTEGCTQSTMDWAAQNGHLDVIKFSHENRAEGCTTYVIDRASRYGHLDVIKFSHNNRSEGCTQAASGNAAANGHMDVIKWLSEHHSNIFTTQEMNYAAQNRHMHVVEWLQQSRSEGCTGTAISAATERGDFEVLRSLVVGKINICEYKCHCCDYYRSRSMRRPLEPMKHPPCCTCGTKAPSLR
jgi:hypothetical protein